MITYKQLPSARFPVAIEAHVEGGWCAAYVKARRFCVCLALSVMRMVW